MPGILSAGTAFSPKSEKRGFVKMNKTVARARKVKRNKRRRSR